MPTQRRPHRSARILRASALLALFVALTALGAQTQSAHSAGTGLVLTFSATPDAAIAAYAVDAGVAEEDRVAIVQGVNAAAQYQELLLGGHPRAPLIVEIKRDGSCNLGEPTGAYVHGRGICIKTGSAHWSTQHWQRVAVAAHEYMHAWQDASGCLAPPRWLTEGMAEYLGQRVAIASGEISAAQLDTRMRQAVAGAATLPPLVALDGPTLIPPAGYAAGALAVERLVAEHGLGSLRAYCMAEAVDSANPLLGWQPAFARVFGQTSDDFYAAFAVERTGFSASPDAASTRAFGATPTVASAGVALPVLDPQQVPNFTWTATQRFGAATILTTSETIEQAAPDNYHLVRSIGGHNLSELWQVDGTRYTSLNGAPAVAGATGPRSLGTPATLLRSALPVQPLNAMRVGPELLDGHATTRFHATELALPTPPNGSSAATASGTLDYWIEDTTGLLLKETGTLSIPTPAGKQDTLSFEITLSAVGTTAPIPAPRTAPAGGQTANGTPTPTAAAGDIVPLVNPAAVPNFSWTISLRITAPTGNLLTSVETIEQSATDSYHVVNTLNGAPVLEVWRVAGVTTVRLGGKQLPPNASASASSPAAKLADGPMLRRDTAIRIGSETLDGRAATHYRDSAASFATLLGHNASLTASVNANAPTGTLDFWIDDTTGVLLKAEGTFQSTSPTGQTSAATFSAALTAIGTTPPVVAPVE